MSRFSCCDSNFSAVHFSVGGLSVELNRIPQVLKELLIKEHSFFLLDAESHPTIDVSICVCQKKINSLSHGDEIFSQQRSTLYKTSQGYLQQLYLTDNKKETPLLTISIAPDFSIVNYYLNSGLGGENEEIDIGRLAFNPFLFQHSVINHQGLIIHAAGGSVQGKGMLFAAPSGTGKSTLSRLLQQRLQSCLFSEERLIVRFLKEHWHVWGTPWHGEGDIARNKSAPLSAIIFLKQSPKTTITPLSPAEGLHKLIQTVSIPWYSEEWTKKGLALCESLVQELPMFELAFRPDQTVVQAVERFSVDL